MDSLDLMIEIERFMSRSGLTHDDSINELLSALGVNALSEE